MNISFTYFILLVFITSYGFSQNGQTKNIKGKITAKITELEGVYIYNQNKKIASISKKNGFFEINVTIGDTLLISSVQFKKVKFALSKKQYDSDFLTIEMDIFTNELEEVEVNSYKNLNPVSLGILEKPAKVYTPAERRLYTASQMTIGSIITLDPLLNWISGRTHQLKKGVSVEKKQFALEKIDYLFENKYFVETLKIPEDYIEGFKYYIIEDEAVRDALNKKNKTMAKFLMSGLSKEYLKILKE